MELMSLECRDVPSVEVFETGAVFDFGSVTVVAAGPGGGPRVDLYLDGEKISAFFAFESEFRGGVQVDYADGQLYAGPGVGGGLIEARYDVTGSVFEVSRQFRGDSALRNGWRPVAPPHPRDPGIVPIENHDRFPVSADHLESIQGQLRYVPRVVQERLVEVGARIVAHSGSVVDLFGGDPDLPTGIVGDEPRTMGMVRSFAIGRTVYVHPSDGAVAHELGHIVWDYLLSAESRAVYRASWEVWPPNSEYERLNLTEAFAEDFRRWCYFGEDLRGVFADGIQQTGE